MRTLLKKIDASIVIGIVVLYNELAVILANVVSFILPIKMLARTMLP